LTGGVLLVEDVASLSGPRLGANLGTTRSSDLAAT